MRLLDYYPDSITNGVGIRQVFFTAGCPHHCKGCQNPQSWNPEGGTDVPNDEVIKTALHSPYNVTFSGGEPLYQPEDLKAILGHLKPNKSIWVYTGYKYEDIVHDSKLASVLPYIDVLVDGRFEESKKDLELRFRGSSNQRIIDVPKTLEKGYIIEWEDDI